VEFKLANILVFVALGVGFLAATLAVGWLLRPHVVDAKKLGTYECGETPLQSAWFNFNPRFYIVALVFLIFDVEVAFTYPVAVVLRRWVELGNGLFAFIELLIFVGILALGLAYVWVKGDLEWVRRSQDDVGWKLRQDRSPRPGAGVTKVEPGPSGGRP
jgi:NADH-quinone oxidoreductase subunit A